MFEHNPYTPLPLLHFDSHVITVLYLLLIFFVLKLLLKTLHALGFSEIYRRDIINHVCLLFTEEDTRILKLGSTTTS